VEGIGRGYMSLVIRGYMSLVIRGYMSLVIRAFVRSNRQNPRKVYIIAVFSGEGCVHGLANRMWEYQPLDWNLRVILCGS